MTRGQALFAAALLAVLTAPLALRPRDDSAARGGEKILTIITPNSMAVRTEMARAFARHRFQVSGERVRIDWRTPGGTSEIARFLNSEYLAAFENYWTGTLRRPWSDPIEHGFSDPKLTPAKEPGADTPAQAARRAFLASSVGCGIDLFFGGGAFDFMQQASAGRLVDCGVVRAHPELFSAQGIPPARGGEPYWDAQGRWIGACLSAFGICYNRDRLRERGIDPPPRRWADLADPRYVDAIALANPTQSGSVNKAFEMLIQQQMLEAWQARGMAPGEEAAAVQAGWAAAMRLLVQIGANARYFADSSSKIALDVASGDAAAGMIIDFYGEFEEDALRAPDGSSRLGYTNAEGGTSFGVDPIGLLRGAPHSELARDFIEWLMSPEGQILWDAKVGSPGGPARYALRRLPILPAAYAPELRALRSDPEVNPYAGTPFTYHDKWTGPLFRPIAFTVRVMCIEPHEELRAAWRAILAAGQPPEAMAMLLDTSAVAYPIAQGQIRSTLAAGSLAEVQLARELSDHFRLQYRQAEALAKARR